MSRVETLSARLVPFDIDTITSGPMRPIAQTRGLLFQYSPDISESIQVNYDKSGDIIHSNESYYVFKNAENRKISLSNVIFTADTEENARYMLAAIHFFRTYQLMDYGRSGTGRPPAPMWFDAFGKFAYGKIPVLLQSVDFNIKPSQHDLVPVTLGGTSAERVTGTSPTTDETGVPGEPRNILPPRAITDQIGNIAQRVPGLNKQLDSNNSDSSAGAGNITWLPAKLEIGSIQLIVQHSPLFWKNEFSLSKYKSGAMVRSMETIPRRGPSGRRGSTDPSGNQEDIPIPRKNPVRPGTGPARPDVQDPFRI